MGWRGVNFFRFLGFHCACEGGNRQSPIANRRGSLDFYGGLFGDHVGEAGDVPVGGPHASVAGEGADAVGIIGAVDADAGLAEADPAYSDGVIGAAWEHVKLVGADAAIEHAFVPAECGHGCDADDFPFSGWSGMGAGAGGDGDAGDEGVAVVEVEDGVFAGDDDAAVGEFRLFGEVSGGRHVFKFEGGDVWDADFVAIFKGAEFFAGVEFHEEFDGAMVALAEEFAVGGVGEIFHFGLRGGLGF